MKHIFCSKYYKDPSLALHFLNLHGLLTLEIVDLTYLSEKLFSKLLEKLTSLKYLIMKDISFNRSIFSPNNTCILTNKWDDLCSLSITNSYLEDSGVITLATTQNWKKIRELILNSNQIKDAGAKAIAINKSWKNLITLELENNVIGKEGGLSLARLSDWQSLKSSQFEK